MNDVYQGIYYLFLILCVVFYFLPAIVAYCRKHHNKLAIAVANLLLGWTAFLWVFALIWSCTAVQGKKDAS